MRRSVLCVPWSRWLAGAALATPAPAADTVILSSVGSASANGWPSYVAIEKGFFAADGIKPDIVFAQSNAAVIQQLAAGSVNVSTNSGLVDPIRAIEKGAPLALIRVEMQAPPYSLLAKPGIKSIGELKGKMISVGGAKDITRIFVERMLEPNGVKPGEFDMTFAGATSARFSALQAGAVDAAILTPPFNFHAQTAGFNTSANRRLRRHAVLRHGGEHQLGHGQQGDRSRSSIVVYNGAWPGSTRRPTATRRSRS